MKCIRAAWCFSSKASGWKLRELHMQKSSWQARMRHFATHSICGLVEERSSREGAEWWEYPVERGRRWGTSQAADPSGSA